MQEPKEDKESRVLVHSVAKHKRLQLTCKERRLKSMNSLNVNKLSKLKCVKAKQNEGLK